MGFLTQVANPVAVERDLRPREFRSSVVWNTTL
jgi:hypothetical protein